MARASKFVSKLTPELIAKIVPMMAEDGLHRRAVSALIGIDEVTFSRWYHRGARNEKGDRLYHEFWLAVNDAEARYMQAAHKTLASAAGRNPKILMWQLSRRFPDLYGRKDNVDPVTPEDQASKIASMREQLIERLEKLFPEEPEPTPAAVPEPVAPVEIPEAE